MKSISRFSQSNPVLLERASCCAQHLSASGRYKVSFCHIWGVFALYLLVQMCVNLYFWPCKNLNKMKYVKGGEKDVGSENLHYRSWRFPLPAETCHLSDWSYCGMCKCAFYPGRFIIWHRENCSIGDLKDVYTWHMEMKDCNVSPWQIRLSWVNEL